MPPLLTLRQFTVPPLGPFSSTVDAGDCVALSGPSGAGKSRFLRGLADLIPHDGQALLSGRELASVPPHEWRRQIMLVPQETAWWSELVTDHFTARLDGAWLDALGLAQAIMQQPVTELSTGQRQRLGLLRALCLNPTVLLLDEPTAHLDAANARKVEALVARFLEPANRAVIWISHDAGQAGRVANRLWQIREGHIKEGPAEEMP